MMLRVPGSVYEECLNPKTTGVPNEEGWPVPELRRAGRGSVAVYRVTPEQAAAIIAWVQEFAEGLTSGVDPDAAVEARRCLRWVAKMREAK